MCATIYELLLAILTHHKSATTTNIQRLSSDENPYFSPIKEQKNQRYEYDSYRTTIIVPTICTG